MRRYLILILILFTARTSAGKPPTKIDPDYLIDTWEVEDGLPESSTTAMVQDRKGYLWFGTFGGLVRFDGVSFTRFDQFNTPQLPSDGIVNLHLDRSGRLWVSTLNGLVIHDGSTWHPMKMPGNYVRTFAERSNGDLFITTFNGLLLEFTAGQMRELPQPPATFGEGYKGLADEAGTWWANRHDFLGSWDGAQWVASVGVNPNGCGTARDGGMWVVAGSTLLKYRQGRQEKRFDLPESPGGFWSLTEDRDGNVWICTFDHGLCRVSANGEFRRYTMKNGLSGKFTRFVFEDSEGDLWIGTNGGGLQRFRPRRFKSIGLSEGLPEPIVRSVCPAAGSLLIGSYGGGVVRARNGAFETIPLPGWKNGPTVYVQSVLLDSANRMWVGTYEQGLWLFDSEGPHHIPPQLSGGNIVALFEDSHRRIWIGGGNTMFYERGNFVQFPADSGRPVGDVRFTEDSLGVVWAANRAGVFRYIDGRFIEVRDNGRAIQNVNALLADRAGAVWIARSHETLLRCRPESITQIDATSGVPVGDIRSIIEDRQGYLWMTSARGIARVRRDELVDFADRKRGPATVNLFDLDDGLPGMEFPSETQPASACDKDGHLWFATSKGVATIDPAALRINGLPPTVDIQAVAYHRNGPKSSSSNSTTAERDTQEITLTGPFARSPKLPAGSTWLEFHFAALSLPTPAKVHYQVRLEPLDAEWRDVGNLRTVYYRDPDPGDYTFRVRASNDDGVWNMEGASLAFTVEPYFWQTTWFHLTTILGLMCSGACVAWCILHVRHRRWREKHHRAQVQGAALVRLSTSRAVSNGNLADALTEITATTASTLDVRQVSVSLMNDTETELEAVNVYDRHRGIHTRGSDFDAASFPRYFEVLHTDRAIDAAHAWSDGRTSELAKPYLIPLGISSVLDAPARAGGRVVGTVRFEHSGPARTWRDDEIGFASAVADQLAQTLINAEKERAYRLVRESEQRFRLMADAAPVMIWRSGIDKLCDFFNKPWLDFRGRTMQQELGNGWTEGVHPDDFDRCLETYRDAVDARVAFQMEYRLRRADGEYRWVLDSGAPRGEPPDQFSGYIGSCLDITERKQVELEVHQQRAELAHLSRVSVLGALSGSLAHELVQPLTAILSNAQAAQRFLARTIPTCTNVARSLKALSRRSGAPTTSFNV
jgi:PAS domain S-box-containing protein